jgi:predicted Fe-Mo cluster-binding NifX family protein
MNIAVTATGPTLDSRVFPEFARTPYVLIVDVATMTWTPIEHAVAPGSDCELARIVVAHRCEAVITGQLTENAFALLADDGITRYQALDLSVRDALAAMEQRTLALIRNADGAGACSGSHH